ncbi:MAG: glycosyltransferase [Limibaculum sp.]
MEPVVFVPLALVAIFALAFPARLRHRRPVRIAVVAALGVLFLNYVTWRIPVTVLPAATLDAQGILVWSLFAIELLAWLDSAILFAALARRTDRSPEADAHEARLRALRPAELPDIDVFITTYNETIEVLERTIVGATAIDWPAERLKIWVLDDGKRDWLRRYCAEHRVGYLTRPDNRHAKAGNVNAAIRRTSGEFFAIFDADFVPQRNIFYRMVGFFADPRIGIVQAPHNFFNHDPMQANLALRRTLPGDQRLFFDEIMPGRDGWDCAFCCGSNSVTRRRAIEAIGNAMPTSSITEDMLLTLTLMRAGYVTRYLNERLAIGLAPESLDALFVQRARWAQGALQILYLKEGPFGPGLGLAARLMFLPTFWLSQALTHVAGLSAPGIYLLTGLLPLVNVTPEAVIYYQLPFILGAISAMRFFAPEQFFPLPSVVLGVLQSFRFLPMLIGTLIRPHGHVFKVTPKGQNAAGPQYDLFTVVLAGSLLAATAAGFILNSDLDTRIVDDVELMPVVALWCTFNAIVLMIVLVTAFSAPSKRVEERFALDEPVLLHGAGGALTGRIRDISLSGLAVRLDTGLDTGATLAPGDGLAVMIAEAGEIPARVVRAADRDLGLVFHLPPSPTRSRLIRKIFTGGHDNTTHNDDALTISMQMIGSIFRDQPAPAPVAPEAAPEAPPPRLMAEIAARARDLSTWDDDTLAETWEAHPGSGGGKAA